LVSFFSRETRKSTNIHLMLLSGQSAAVAAWKGSRWPLVSVSRNIFELSSIPFAKGMPKLTGSFFLITLEGSFNIMGILIIFVSVE
jgi:hypothetical protein